MEELWRRAFLIRALEERLLALFAEGKVQGTVHTCSGQEWSALAVVNALGPNDPVLSNHRGHGHFLARHPNMIRPLLAEIMGAAEGLCGGIGGSQHLFAPLFYSNGIQGGMTPIAAGLALAARRTKSDRIVTVFIGDGTTGEGVLYETMNIAALWKLPLLFVLENNGYAQSTPTSRTIAGSIQGRAESFGLEYFKGDIWRTDELREQAKKAAAHARAGNGPAFLEIECFRLNAHSKGDDIRPDNVIAEFRERDPLAVFRRENEKTAALYASDAEREIDGALAAIDPAPCRYSPIPNQSNTPPRWRPLADQHPMRHAGSIHNALREMLAHGDGTVLLGEDIEAPYGGAFRVTKELSRDYPENVKNTPISEAALIGIGTGLALGGCRPVVEIMFGDFLTLAFDQLQQHAAKIPLMSNRRAAVPLIVRAPVGGRRGYGPTHSQSLEKHFLGIPGLTVAALSSRIDPIRLYRAAHDLSSPVLMIENKSLYPAFQPAPPVEGYVYEETDGPFPVVRVSPAGGNADVTIACYGAMLDMAESVLADAFRDDEILCEILCYSCLTPLDLGPLCESLGRTGRLLTLEEGPGQAGWGAEIAAQSVYAGLAPAAVRRLSHDGVIPASASREAELLPNPASLRNALRSLLSPPSFGQTLPRG